MKPSPQKIIKLWRFNCENFDVYRMGSLFWEVVAYHWKAVAQGGLTISEIAVLH